MTYEQPKLWDPIQASIQRDAGIAAADENANPEWRKVAREAIRFCARSLPDFTADEVIIVLNEMGAPETHNLAALGPLFLAASRAGEICKTGEMRRSGIARRHRDLVVWTSRA